jgi:hypothetical protein
VSAEMQTCTECGMVLKDAGEFHPYTFCVLKKAGLDPWREMVRAHPELPSRVPLVGYSSAARLATLVDYAGKIAARVTEKSAL